MAKKKKRRSFWEPDSCEVVAWMDAQDNLGQSLQLIITDAIFKYGAGDAIEVHLQERFADSDFKCGPKPKREYNKRDRLPIVDQNNDPVNKPHTIVAKTEVKNEPMVPIVPAEIIPEIITVPPLQQTVAPIVATIPEEKPYDPVEIMFGDIDATYNK